MQYGGFGDTYGGYAATNNDNNAGGYHVSPAGNKGGGGGGGSQQEGEKSGASVQRLTPLLVSQIVKAVQQHKDDSFQVDGQELNQVAVVGTIKSVAKLSTNLTIVLTDATGEIDVRQWLDADDTNADRFRAGMMVRVIGHLREFQEKRSVLAFKIRVVEDPAELQYHQTLATYVHLYNTFGPLPDVGAAAGGAGGAQNAGVSNAYSAPAPAYGGAGAGGGGGGPGGMSDIHKTVLQSIRSVKGSEGAALDDVMRTLRNVPQNQVREAIEYLSAEGHIYSTIDEQHFRASN